MSSKLAPATSTVAQALAAAFQDNRVARIFGVPGGGSSLDVMDAAAAAGIEFVLTHTESAAVMMAAVTAELDDTLGVALTTKGPGTANGANGVAYASLDRSAVMFLSDGFDADEQAYVTHQVFDQRALLAPITKGYSRLDGDDVPDTIADLVALATAPPRGPVFVELTGATAKKTIHAGSRRNRAVSISPLSPDDSALASARELLARAARPVVVVGLEARNRAVAEAVRELTNRLNCPVLATYKAKGVVADQSPRYVGIFTGGAAEADCLNQADLILLCGVDPVEFIRKPWRYPAPVIDVSWMPYAVHYLTPRVGLYGPLDAHIRGLTAGSAGTLWTAEEITALRADINQRLEYKSTGGIAPQHVVTLAAEASRALPVMPRITVDAGAHMFSAMAFWPCAEPHDVLISNGLATMAFALPAAVAAALHEPDRPVIAFTGDGGLFMCLGELATAVDQQARIVVIVFNDQSLSLIDIKQQQRGFEPRGVRWERPDFAAVMNGLGGRGYRVDNIADYQMALKKALDGSGPALIDVCIDATGYPEQLKALRG